MLDNIEVLEEKIAHLIKKFKEAQDRIAKLKTENEHLRGQLESHAHMEKENRALQDKIKDLEKEAKSWTTREGEIRDRLTEIISQVSSIEQEISSFDTDEGK